VPIIQYSELSGTTTAQLSSCSSPDELKSKVDDFSEGKSTHTCKIYLLLHIL